MSDTDNKDNPKSSNITPVAHQVSADVRWQTNGHKGGVLWLTGLSASGKSTLSILLERHLFDKGWRAYTLDGDNVRGGLSSNLGFSHQDRSENIRRVAETAALFADAGFITISALISPYAEDRRLARDIIKDNFFEVHLATDLAVCEGRDPRGLYGKARAGIIADFTGVSAPYEVPTHPDLTLDTGNVSPEDSLRELAAFVDRVFAL